ncbi:hypothetical protein TNIN_383171 [Trichonephila inaurata madagascariensis]|uniref:Uncharacterized protein n=1 Tax=Trichonephila inaurata madagascariensis TaxID=2747483 RepID=A0A8X7BVS1_9ARAC|nr:hypothetical protein TNIN_383171 [Trichonephila inaurata madagascariensis]
MERFVYDVFVKTCTRVGVTEFPESEYSLNPCEIDEIVRCVSIQVLSYQLSWRDEWKGIFGTIVDNYSYEDISEIVDHTLSENEVYKSDPAQKIKILFAVHVELFLFFHSLKKSINFEELPRSWYKIYTRDISRDFKDNISLLAVNKDTKDLLGFVAVCLIYFLKYFIPYGAKNYCSGVYNVFLSFNPSLYHSPTKIIIFKNIDSFVTGVRGAEFFAKWLHLPVHERLGIAPHESLLKIAFGGSESSTIPGTVSDVSCKARNVLLGLYKRPYSCFQEWKVSQGLSKPPTDIFDPSQNIQANIFTTKCGPWNSLNCGSAQCRNVESR